MSHCVADSLNDIIEDGSEEALKRSSAQMATLIESPLTKVVENALWIYEIVSPNRPESDKSAWAAWSIPRNSDRRDPQWNDHSQRRDSREKGRRQSKAGGCNPKLHRRSQQHIRGYRKLGFQSAWRPLPTTDHSTSNVRMKRVSFTVHGWSPTRWSSADCRD